MAVALANIADEPAPIRIVLKRPEYPLPKEGVLRRVGEDIAEAAVPFDKSGATLGIVLDSSDTRVYEAAPR